MDFRSWLSQNSGNTFARVGGAGMTGMDINGSYLLNHAGNDGKVGSGNPQWMKDAAAQAYGQYQKYINQQNSNDGKYYTGSGGGSSYSAAEARAAAKEAEQARFYQALLDSLGGRKAADRNRILENYNNSMGSLAQQRDAAYGNLDRESGKLGDQRKKSLGQIQADTQTLLQGANTQLGMYGTGNSSATDMSAFGAADLANKSTADVTDQYNEQMGDIALSRDNFKKEYEQEKNDLDQWQKDQVHDLDTKYTNLENDYRGRIGGQGNLDAVVQTFQNMKAPEVNLKNLPEYKAAGINSADLSGQVSAPNMSAGQAQEYFTGTTQANQRKKKSEGGYSD